MTLKAKAKTKDLALKAMAKANDWSLQTNAKTKDLALKPMAKAKDLSLKAKAKDMINEAKACRAIQNSEYTNAIYCKYKRPQTAVSV